ncbi:flavin-containing amine oxidoreductase-domain containing protein [Globomyces pollinis-pini]|nr:flavin-containing amine oxidoreductase-domain containing protein [Globomyces pollinis-pini]
MGLEDLSLRTALSLVGWKPKSALDDLLEYKGIEEEFAGNVDTISATYGLLSGSEFGDQSHLVVDQRGYKFIPEQIFANANATKKIVFNAIAKEIVYSKNGVQVTLTNGDIYKAEYLISTVSLGVLQQDVIKFNPPLPDWKREALAKFRMETYTKIFLNFNTQFWDDKPYTYYASNQKGFYPNWKNFMSPGFLSNIIPKGNFVCMVTLTNAQSRRVERLSDKEVEDEIMTVLADMYPGKTIPRPKEILVPRWGINPLFFGSFTNWPIGMSFESWENLVAPLNNRVFFGGEMASTESFGYVHGGYQAGINTGLDVAACIKGKCKPKNFYPEGLKAAIQKPVIVKRSTEQ